MIGGRGTCPANVLLVVNFYGAGGLYHFYLGQVSYSTITILENSERAHRQLDSKQRNLHYQAIIILANCHPDGNAGSSMPAYSDINEEQFRLGDCRSHALNTERVERN